MFKKTGAGAGRPMMAPKQKEVLWIVFPRRGAGPMSLMKMIVLAISVAPDPLRGETIILPLFIISGWIYRTITRLSHCLEGVFAHVVGDGI